MRKHLAITAALIAALSGSLSACNDTGGNTGTKVASVTVKASPESTTTAGETTMTDDSSTMTVALTGTAKWRNGVAMKLSGFKRGTSGDYATPDHTPYLRFTVTLTNGDKTPLDASALTLSCPNGGEEIFDTDKGLNGAPSGHILSGKSLSWQIACAFQAADTYAQIEATPFDSGAGWYRTAIFTGKVA